MLPCHSSADILGLGVNSQPGSPASAGTPVFVGGLEAGFGAVAWLAAVVGNVDTEASAFTVGAPADGATAPLVGGFAVPGEAVEPPSFGAVASVLGGAVVVVAALVVGATLVVVAALVVGAAGPTGCPSSARTTGAKSPAPARERRLSDARTNEFGHSAGLPAFSAIFDIYTVFLLNGEVC